MAPLWRSCHPDTLLVGRRRGRRVDEGAFGELMRHDHVEVGNTPHHGKPSRRWVQQTSPGREWLKLSYTEDMAQGHMEVEAGSLPPAENMQRQWRQRHALCQQSKQVRIKEVARERKGGRLMVVIGRTPGCRVLVTRLLAVRFVHDEGEQARLVWRSVAHISIVGPLAQINESMGAAFWGRWHVGLGPDWVEPCEAATGLPGAAQAPLRG